MNETLPHEKGFHVSWEQMHRDSRALAWRLDGRGPGEGGVWRMVVAITRGGMVPACVVARELNIRMVDTISVKSYDHQTQAEAMVLKAPDAAIGDGAGVLIVDDLADTGRTLQVVRDLYPKAHFATVYSKPRGAPLVDTFITSVSQDTWIFFPWDMALMYVDPMRGTA
ncbi:xanthine phosphoribosyltransferase [Rhodobacteraceae bacterium NNCM2]|nr:xanthine phosphoribosyltransferase [Coraliihabitans acroporae]